MLCNVLYTIFIMCNVHTYHMKKNSRIELDKKIYHKEQVKLSYVYT